MLKKSALRRLWAFPLVSAFVFLGWSASSAMAQSTHVTPSAIRSAAVWFAPLPNSTLFTPQIVQHVQRIADEERWKLPEFKPWPTVDGEPIVETRRLDEMWYTVDEHDNARRLRARFRDRRLEYLSYLNPDVDFDNLEHGQQLLVWKRGDKVSQSHGRANWGRLRHGEPMPPGEGYRIQFPHRAFGTYYAVSEIVRVMDDFHARFPDTPDLLVGDLSAPHGRRLRPHKSHQSGRDVDITYPRKTEPHTYRHFTHISNAEFDVEKSFWLVKHFVDSGQVEYMFVDRKWQRRMWQFAKEQGATDEWLSAVFEYRSKRSGRALVRYSRGHDDHLHIRFKCQETDARCF